MVLQEISLRPREMKSGAARASVLHAALIGPPLTRAASKAAETVRGCPAVAARGVRGHDPAAVRSPLIPGCCRVRSPRVHGTTEDKATAAAARGGGLPCPGTDSGDCPEPGAAHARPLGMVPGRNGRWTGMRTASPGSRRIAPSRHGGRKPRNRFPYWRKVMEKIGRLESRVGGRDRAPLTDAAIHGPPLVAQSAGLAPF